MIPDKKEQLYDRLSAKDLDHQFRHRIEHGMGCSPFVAEAIERVVKEVYTPFIESPGNLRPGQLLFGCLSKGNKASTAIAQAEQLSVVLTLDGGMEDLSIRRKQGVEALRRHRICRLCQEAYAQGGLLTVEDLAYRLLNVGERTILRDLSLLRKRNELPPLRSTVKDIGRAVSHKSVLIKNWLKGDELSDLQRKYNHSLSAIENYINTFKRVVVLQNEQYSAEQTAYMLKISPTLVEAYRKLWSTYQNKALPHRKRELDEALRLGRAKKTPKTRPVS